MNIDRGSMSDHQIQDIADRLATALEGLAPRASDWWAGSLALASIAILVAAAFVTARARSRKSKDQRASRSGRSSYAMKEWWRRAEWALNASASANDTMFSYGIAVLRALAKSSHAGPGDKAVFDAVWKASSTGMQDKAIHRFLQQLQSGIPDDLMLGPAENNSADSGQGCTTGRGSAEMRLSTLRREILAAQLKVVLDEQLDRQTSASVHHLAMLKLSLDGSP